MTIHERQAWFTLIVIGTTVVVLAAIYALTRNPVVSQAAFGITGALGATGLIGRRERGEGKIVTDERDTEIAQTALTIAFSAFWILFLIAAIAPMLVLGPDAVIRTSKLTAIAWVAVCFVFAVRAAVTVVMYRRGSRG